AIVHRRTPPRRNTRKMRPSESRRSVWYSWQISRSTGSAIPATPRQTTGMPHCRAFSANTTGNRPAHASSPTGSTPDGAGAAAPGRRPGRSILALLQPEVLLDPLDVLAQLGELLQRHHDPHLLAVRGRRRAEHPRVGGHV